MGWRVHYLEKLDEVLDFEESLNTNRNNRKLKVGQTREIARALNIDGWDSKNHIELRNDIADELDLRYDCSYNPPRQFNHRELESIFEAVKNQDNLGYKEIET